jgi:hypothetical protein
LAWLEEDGRIRYWLLDIFVKAKDYEWLSGRAEPTTDPFEVGDEENHPMNIPSRYGKVTDIELRSMSHGRISRLFVYFENGNIYYYDIGDDRYYGGPEIPKITFHSLTPLIVDGGSTYVFEDHRVSLIK